MSKKKGKKKRCHQTLPELKIIPVRDIPDNCQLICVGPFCTLACFGAGGEVIHCDIICDDAGHCTVNCMPD